MNSVVFLKVRIWNVDNIQNKHIKITKNTVKVLGNRSYSTKIDKNVIKPLTPPKSIKPSIFSTMDIETITHNKIKVPIAISHHNGKTNKTVVFLINHKLIETNLDLALKTLWKNYFDYLVKNKTFTVFIHNLGSFDGYFLYKALLNHFSPKNVSCIIDKSYK